MNTRPNAASVGSRRKNRGVVLFISLIVLVAMSLGGIAIMRSVDTTTLIAGNLAFKLRALHAADSGVANAMTWLLANKATLANDNVAEGYFSSESFDWTVASGWNSNTKTLTTDAAGNTVAYKIHRMCTLAATPYNGSSGGVANVCGQDAPITTNTTKPQEGDSSTGNTVFAPPPGLYYRVTVRSSGPRNTQSYIQSMLILPI